MRKLVAASLIGSVALFGLAHAKFSIEKKASEQGETTSAVATLTESDVQKIVEKTILENPTLIIQSLQNFEKQRMAMAQENAASKAKQFERDLFNNKQDPQSGNPNGSITIVEFLDYQCGYCKRMHEVIDQLVKNNNDVRVVYKLMPFLGERSKQAAELALASLQTGAFSSVHKSFIENKARLTDAFISETAKTVKASEAHMKIAKLQLEGNVGLAQKLDVEATPTLFIQTKSGDIRIVAGYVPLEKLQEKLK